MSTTSGAAALVRDREPIIRSTRPVHFWMAGEMDGRSSSLTGRDTAVSELAFLSMRLTIWRRLAELEPWLVKRVLSGFGIPADL